MNDRELLEMAAKATGNEWHSGHITANGKQYEWEEWDPLVNDGDALRLAVTLDIHVYRYETMTTARPLNRDFGCDERDDGDPYAATRRAIVRAAAEIGRKM